jgi:hypothetical protein
MKIGMMEQRSNGVMRKRKNNSKGTVEFDIPILQDSITPIL